MPAATTRKDIDAWLRKVDRSVGKFARTDRRRILTKASRHVVNELRPRIPVRKEPKGRPYRPGNLRRSIGRITGLKRTPAVFVGPRRSRRGRTLANDGYYAAAMLRDIGQKTPPGVASRRFRRRFTDPAARAAAPKVVREVIIQSRRALRGEFQKRGLR